MARALWLPARLKEFGCKVETVGGWEHRGADHLAPEGVLLHHTASAPGRNAPSLATVIHGRPDLPGPLCQVLLARDATCIVVASGLANHAGRGNWRGLTSNRQLLGIEAENDGRGEHWPARQLDAFQKATAAMLHHLGRGSEWAAGHKEYALPKGRKIDPALIDLDAFRRGVQHLLDAPPEDDLTADEHDMLASLVKKIDAVRGGVEGGDGFTSLKFLDDRLKQHEDAVVQRVVAALKPKP